MTSRRENERVLGLLEKSRDHIDKMWVKGAWFTAPIMDDPDWQNAQDGDNPSGLKVEHVTGVCAAGSVLYSMDYTDEQWVDQGKVRPVIEALFEALPPRSAAMSRYRQHFRNPYFQPDDGDYYDNKVEAITTYNDAPRRTKKEILALFDRAIERQRTLVPPIIQESVLS